MTQMVTDNDIECVAFHRQHEDNDIECQYHESNECVQHLCSSVIVDSNVLHQECEDVKENCKNDKEQEIVSERVAMYVALQRMCVLRHEECSRNTLLEEQLKALQETCNALEKAASDKFLTIFAAAEISGFRAMMAEEGWDDIIKLRHIIGRLAAAKDRHDVAAASFEVAKGQYVDVTASLEATKGQYVAASKAAGDLQTELSAACRTQETSLRHLDAERQTIKRQSDKLGQTQKLYLSILRTILCSQKHVIGCQNHRVRLCTEEKRTSDEYISKVDHYETDRDNDRPIDRETDRDNDRPIDRETDRDNDGPIDRETDRDNDGPIDRETDRDNDGPIDRETDRDNDGPIDRETDRDNDGPIDRETDRDNDGPIDRETDRYNDGPIDRETDRYNAGPIDRENEGPIDRENDGLIDIEYDGLIDRETDNDGRIDRETDNDGRIDRGDDGLKDRETDSENDGLIDRETDGLIDRENDGLIDRENDGLIDREDDRGNDRRIESCDNSSDDIVRDNKVSSDVNLNCVDYVDSSPTKQRIGDVSFLDIHSACSNAFLMEAVFDPDVMVVGSDNETLVSNIKPKQFNICGLRLVLATYIETHQLEIEDLRSLLFCRF